MKTKYPFNIDKLNTYSYFCGMAKMSLLFLGSKPIGYHCLHYLIQEKDKLNLEIVGLLTNDNPRFGHETSILKLANQHQIPVIDNLDEMPSVDYIYSVQYHEILKAEHIMKARKLAINLHMAPLPDYRGCNQFSFAIAENKKEFGTTIHVMDNGIDHGDILFEKRFPISTNCWVNELYQQTFDASLDLFIETIRDILNENFIRLPQKDLVNTRGTSIHYRSEIQQLKQIDLSWEQEKIERYIRATYMPGFEPPFTLVEGEKLYFTKNWA